MTKTCAGAAVGDGSGLELGKVRIVGEAAGLGWVWAELWVQPASMASAMRLTANRWAVEMRPERGGRITSLRLDGEELLDQGIGVDQPTANGFVEGGAFGWDEMVPNVEPTEALPDHGEAWRMPWEVVDPNTLRARGRLVPWVLERRIDLDSALLASYIYLNAGQVRHDAFWCGHPLFRYEPELEVSAPVPRPSHGASTKVFLPRATVDRVRLRWKSGLGIEMSWDPAVTPDVAIWVCNGDLGGYRQIAIEPATTSPQLEPGSTLRWWLRIDAL